MPPTLNDTEAYAREVRRLVFGELEVHLKGIEVSAEKRMEVVTLAFQKCDEGDENPVTSAIKQIFPMTLQDV